MPNILTIDYQSNSLGAQFTTSLKNTGFAVLKNHPIPKNLISDIYDEWKLFFDSNYKHSYLFDKIFSCFESICLVSALRHHSLSVKSSINFLKIGISILNF